jgi:hypothetical protein
MIAHSHLNLVSIIYTGILGKFVPSSLPGFAHKNPQARQAAGLSEGRTISSVSFLRRKPLCPRMREGGFFIITHKAFSKHQLLGKSPFSHKNRFLEVQSENSY